MNYSHSHTHSTTQPARRNNFDIDGVGAAMQPSPLPTAAARTLAAEHSIDLATLPHVASFISVSDVQAEVKRRQAEVERRQLREKLPMMSHREMRKQLKLMGVTNSFRGATCATLRDMIVRLIDGQPIPQHRLCVEVLRKVCTNDYDAMLRSCSLDRLAASCMPETLWTHYARHGWCASDLQLSKRERRMIALCHRLALCELGVDPRRKATWANCEDCAGYEPTYGWLRNPTNLQSQLYLATHPKVYRLWVGLYSRLLLRHHEESGAWPPGIHSEIEAVQASLELRVQLYNTKLALPRMKERRFSHLDCDWTRDGCTTTPAPQCFVATSPQNVAGRRVFTCRFVNVEQIVIRHHKARKRLQMEADSAATNASGCIGSSPQGASVVDTAHDTHKKQGRAPGPPYVLPRKDQGASTGTARREPTGTDFSGPRSSGPDDLQVGECVLFGHLVAHEFVQHATLAEVDRPREGDDVGEREEERVGMESGTSPVHDEPIPLGFTRTAEYPYLSSPRIHGVPHQRVDEVLAGLLNGTPPRRWAHVYTGNVIPASSSFNPPLPPLPAVPSTPLARVLVGVDNPALCGAAALGWLIESAREGDCQQVDGAVNVATERHRRVMLKEMLSSLRSRLRRLATGRLCKGEISQPAGASGLEANLQPSEMAIRNAACAAMEDTDLRPKKKRKAIVK